MSFTTGGGGGSSPANSLQFVLQASTLTLSTTPQDMPGLTLTLATAGVYLVVCTVDVTLQAGDEGAIIVAQLVVAGAAQSNVGNLSAPNALTRATIAQQWRVNASAGTVIKMQASKSAGSGASTATRNCALSALWVSP